MIKDSMTLQEVGKCLLKTGQMNYFRFAMILFRHKKEYQSIFFNSGEDSYDFQTIKVEVGNISFYICPYVISKSDYEKYGTCFCLLASFTYKDEEWYCMFSNYNRQVTIFTSDFFEQYIQTHLKDDSVVDIDSVRYFFKSIDYLINAEHIDNTDLENAILSGTKIGILRGFEACKDVSVYNEYVDKELLQGDEMKRLFNESLQRFDSIEMDSLGDRILAS